MVKKKIYLWGIITLLVFPIPAFITLYFHKQVSLFDFLDLHNFTFENIIGGSMVGIVYALIVNWVMKFKIFDLIPLKIESLIESLNLNYSDAFFLSICARVGEELLFRVGIQHYLGIIPTAIIFVALHGYLNPFNWKQSLYGIVVLPFSLILGFGYYYYGVWFAIFAHILYDFVLFVTIIKRR